jgi:myo-inositol-1(or 4)-monophosphatase
MPNDFELASSLVRDAGELADRMRRGGIGVDFKTSISDVVTAADLAAEEMVVTRLLTERPDDGLVGEEGTNIPGERIWFIDPVDGTYNFASGLPTWCSALALLDGTEQITGAVFQPSTGELWLGGRDWKTTCNGDSLPPLSDAPLADVSVATYLHPGTLPDDSVRLPLLHAVEPAATVRMLGSGSIELAAVAAGRLGAYIQYDCEPWDWYPGSTLVVAAGGTIRVLELGGHRWHLAGPERVVDELHQRLILADSGS